MQLFRPKFEQDPRWQRDNWTALHQKEAQTYKATLALPLVIAELEKEAVATLGRITIPPGCVDTIQNLVPEVRQKVFEAGKELASAKILLAVASSSPEFKFAEKEFAPLLNAAAERDKADERLRVKREQAAAALTIAREKTWKQALERAEEDPAIQKAERELADATAAAEAAEL